MRMPFVEDSRALSLILSSRSVRIRSVMSRAIATTYRSPPKVTDRTVISIGISVPSRATSGAMKVCPDSDAISLLSRMNSANRAFCCGEIRSMNGFLSSSFFE